MVETELTATHQGDLLTMGGKTFEMEAPIDDIIVAGGKIVVQLDWESFAKSDPRHQRNVICLDGNGGEIWRIERRDGPLGEDRKPRSNPFVGIEWKKDKKKVVAYDMNGLCFEVDLETGGISNPVFTR